MTSLSSTLSAGTGLLVFGLTAGILGFISLIFILMILHSRGKVRASQSWLTTDGKILHSMAEYQHSSEGGAYYPVVTYEYNANGQLYRSQQIRFGTRVGFGSQSIVQRVVNRYPIGSSQPVYYNPDNPSEAVLDRTTGGANTVLGCVVGIFVIVIIFVGGIVAVSVYGTQAIQQVISGAFGAR
jgi:hypothetical protein